MKLGLLFGATLLASVVLAVPPGVEKHQPQLSYLKNAYIELGADLNLGGALTYLSAAGKDENVINSWDWGRQVQLSYYSGPIPFTPEGKQPDPAWRGLGWNPIQAGDHFGNASKTITSTNDGKTLYMKCIPKQWPLNNVALEGSFEVWYTLDGPAIRMRARLNNARTDHTQWPARDQEMPAVYANGPYHRLFTYTGDKPFSAGALTRIEHPFGKGGSPWGKWRATEHWAALLNDEDWGLGVWNPACLTFHGGFAGRPGSGGPRDAATGYIGPVREEILDHNIWHEYTCTLILGDVKTIREYVYKHAEKPRPPNYRFTADRQGWHYRNATDAGWPITGQLDVRLEKEDPQLIGPAGVWNAESAPVLYVRAALRSEDSNAKVFWSALDDQQPTHRVPFTMIGDGQMRTYSVPLRDAPEYRGLITRLRLDPIPAGKPGDWIKVVSIGFDPPGEK